ncbi:hypothetical protein JCM17039_03310 [Blautia glucerasea]
MKAKKIIAAAMAVGMILSVSVNTMASGSITDSIDTNNVTATTPTTQEEVVGNMDTVETQTVGVTVSRVTEDMYEEEVQEQVNALNDAPAESTVRDAFLAVFTEDELPVIDLYNKDGILQEKMDLSEFKFLSSVMDLSLETEPTEENPVEVTFTANNLTDNTEVFILHLCEEHNWEMLETEITDGNQVTASFHSASPIALIYREKPAEESEADTDKIAP